MRPAHYITLAAAVGLIVLLYFAVGTTPPAKPTSHNHDHPAEEGHSAATPHSVAPMSTDSVLAHARQQLPAHAIEEIDSIENKIAAMRDSTRMADLFRSLGMSWNRHRQRPAAAYYYAKAAKLENSEKNLNFAGQFFLDLIQNAGSPEMQAWAANEAVNCFSQALELNPDNDTTKMALAATYIEGTGATMQGVQLLLGITREEPDNVPANLMLGRLSIQSGQFDKAIQRFETVLKSEPENTEALYFLAEAHKGKGNIDKAIELFEKCKKIVNNPEFSKDIDQYIKSFKTI